GLEDFQDRPQRPLQKARIFGESATRTSEGSLEPYDLNLCAEHLAGLKLSLHMDPIVVEWKGDVCCGRSIPSSIDHQQAGVFARVSVSQPDELRKLMRRIGHADTEHHDFSGGRRFAVSVHRLHCRAKRHPGFLATA